MQRVLFFAALIGTVSGQVPVYKFSSTTCDEGYTKITTTSRCDAAAVALESGVDAVDYDTSSTSSYSLSYPSGCFFLWDYESLRFNPAETAESCTDDNKCLCVHEEDACGFHKTLFVGNNVGKILHFKNTGSVTNPTFVEQTGTDNPFNGVEVGYEVAPTFVDVDSDGDMDAFVGGNYGTILHFKNTGSVTNPTFVEQTGTDNPFNGVNVGYSAAPTFVDVDSDGDMDAFVGNYDGKIFHFKNTGSVTNPTFVEQTGTDNPFNGVNVGYSAAPTFVDVDSDGDMDAFVGNDVGNILHFKNTGRTYGDGCKSCPKGYARNGTDHDATQCRQCKTGETTTSIGSSSCERW